MPLMKTLRALHIRTAAHYMGKTGEKQRREMEERAQLLGAVRIINYISKTGNAALKEKLSVIVCAI